MPSKSSLRCLRCDTVLPAGDWACLACGGPALVRASDAPWAVVVDEVVSMAGRKDTAALVATWAPGLTPEQLESKLRGRLLLASPVSLAAARTAVERLKQTTASARLVESSTLRRSLVRRLFGPIPLLLLVFGIVAAVLVDPMVFFAGLLAAVVIAAVSPAVEAPVIVPVTAPPPLPRQEELLAGLAQLDGAGRAEVATIVRGSFVLLARAERDGLTVDVGKEYGMGSAVSGVIDETLAAIGRTLARDPEGPRQLATLAATMREVTATTDSESSAVPSETAEERLRREVKVARELVGGTAVLPAGKELEP